jgi:hypothetical protein
MGDLRGPAFHPELLYEILPRLSTHPQGRGRGHSTAGISCSIYSWFHLCISSFPPGESLKYASSMQLHEYTVAKGSCSFVKVLPAPGLFSTVLFLSAGKVWDKHHSEGWSREPRGPPDIGPEYSANLFCSSIFKVHERSFSSHFA